MKKYIIIFISIIFIMSFLIGLNNNIMLYDVNDFVFNYKYFFINSVIYIIALLISLIGLPIYVLLFLYEIFTCGISLGVLLTNYSLIGLLFFIIIFCIKLIFLFLLFLNSFYSIKITKNLFKYKIKKQQVCKENYKRYFKKIFIITIILIILSLLFCFINKMLISYFIRFLLSI